MLLTQQARLQRLDERRAVVRVAGTWIGMVQSRLPLLEKAMETALGSPRQITLEASDKDERAEATPSPSTAPGPAASAPFAPKADAMRPEPVVAVATPIPAPTPVPAASDSAGAVEEVPPLPPQPAEVAAPTPTPRADRPDASAGIPTPAADAQVAPEKGEKPQTRAEDRLLEESTTLLADFFNGQVIALEPQDED